MSLPTVQGIGTPASSAGGDITPTWPTHRADDTGLLIVETANQPVAAPDGWTEAPCSPTIDDVNGVAIQVFERPAISSAETDPTITGAADHTYAVIVTVRGALVASPFHAASSAIRTGNVGSLPGVFTRLANCLVVCCAAWSADRSAALSSGETNSDLAGLTEQYDAGTTDGSGGGIIVITGEKATAGEVGITTTTLATSSALACITFAIRPAGWSVNPSGHVDIN